MVASSTQRAQSCQSCQSGPSPCPCDTCARRCSAALSRRRAYAHGWTPSTPRAQPKGHLGYQEDTQPQALHTHRRGIRLRGRRGRHRLGRSNQRRHGCQRNRPAAAAEPHQGAVLDAFTRPLTAGYSFGALEHLWMAVGGSGRTASHAACIAEHESGGNPNAISPTNDWGLWQIHNGGPPHAQPGRERRDRRPHVRQWPQLVSVDNRLNCASATAVIMNGRFLPFGCPEWIGNAAKRRPRDLRRGRLFSPWAV